MKTVALSHRSSTQAPLAHSSSPLAPPLTQNTAPVLEFNCLYSHDIRRKNKRWQDGFLRYHTFNRRIMLYDVPRNFLGDSHWKGGEALQEGDEVDIEHSGILVQVAENIGRTETDLSGLIVKRPRKKSSGPVLLDATPVSAFNSRHAGHASLSTTHAHSKHRTLASLLGSRRGIVGKAALPEESPFQLGHADRHTRSVADDRPAKRQRTNAVARDIGHSNCTTKQARQCMIYMERSSPLLPLPKQDTDGFIDLSTQDDEIRLTSSINSVRHEVNSPLQKQASVPAHTSERPRCPAPKRSRKDQVSPAARNVTASPTPLQTSESPGGDNIVLEGEGRQNGDKLSKASAVPLVSHHSMRTGRDKPFQRMSPQPSATPRRNSPTKRYAEDKAAEECSTLRLSSYAAKKNQLLCRAQLSKKSAGAYAPCEAESARNSDAHRSNRSTDRGQATKTQKQLLEERLTKSNRSIAITAERIETLPHSTDLHPVPVKATALNKARDVVSESTRPRQNRVEPDIVTKAATLHIPGDAGIKDFNRAVSCTPMIESKRQAPTTTSVRPKPSKKTSPEMQAKGVQEAVCRTGPANFTPATDIAVAQTTIANQQLKTSIATRPQAPHESMRRTSSVRQVAPNAGPKQHLNEVKPVKVNEALPIALLGPWSREAFDLFTWRPPGWDEEKWCVATPNP